MIQRIDRTALILDTDSDADDALALALLLGSPEVTVAATTTVYGNTTLRATPGAVDVLAVGSLTNVAGCLRRDPSFAGTVRRLVVMGGDLRDESERVAEHNLMSDLAATREVLSSNIPIVLGGLDLTERVRFGSTEVEQIRASGRLAGFLT